MNNSIKVDVDIGLDILGTKVEYRTGSYNYKFIPSIYIVIEDKLAKSVIETLWDRNESVSAKYIFSGSWMNQVSCLYGFFTYGMELQDSFSIPSFGIVAVNDGDIPEKSTNKRIDSAIKGNFPTDKQKLIKDKISKSVISFNLEINDESIKALPEYNHKRWFEGITLKSIKNRHQEETFCFLRDEREIETMLEVIEFSKSLPNEEFPLTNDKGKLDYHLYYTALKAYRPKNTDHKMNSIHWYVLSAIKEYNLSKWKFYTNDVKQAILKLCDENKDAFISSSFNFE